MGEISYNLSYESDNGHCDAPLFGPFNGQRCFIFKNASCHSRLLYYHEISFDNNALFLINKD